MQPDPSLFLRAFRKEVLSPALFDAGLASGASAVVAARMGEGLAQIILRLEVLPELLRKIRPDYVDLLAEVAGELRQAGLPEAADAQSALAAAGPPDAAGEGDVLLHDRLERALASGLRALRVADATNPRLNMISIAACRLEEVRRRAYNEALATLKANAPANGDPTAHPEPTNAEVTAFLRSKFPDSPQIEARNLRRLAGFNSKEIFFLDIVGRPGWPTASVLRREPAFNVTGTSLAAEQGLLDHLARLGAPVPRVLVADPGEPGTSSGFIIMEKLGGAPRTAAGLGPKARDLLLEIARIAASIHSGELPREARFGDLAMSARDRVTALVDYFYDRWTAEKGEESLVIEAGYQWLRANVDRLSERVGLVHGDFNLRNFLIEGDRVSSVLDWELAHLGDVAEDLAYVRFDVEQVMPWEDFLAEYGRHAVETPSDAAIDYFDVYASFWRAVLAGIVAGGFARGDHGDFITASCTFVEFREDCDRLAHHVAREGRRSAS